MSQMGENDSGGMQWWAECGQEEEYTNIEPGIESAVDEFEQRKATERDNKLPLANRVLA